jgi:DMSO/TMAO reductase YedYZ molybdopterin-dependent catalytic subunit/thiosulfate reductase cytochrome b subunit
MARVSPSDGRTQWRELSPRRPAVPRHPRFVRVTHWINAGCVAALFVSGIVILLAHPRLYWGEAGGFGGPALIDLPLPRLGFGGIPRSVHFFAAWLTVMTGVAYVCAGIITGHFRRHLTNVGEACESRYTSMQRLSYVTIIAAVFPTVIWTGLAMSPALAARFPFLVDVLGGHQSARTVHFAASIVIFLFAGAHILMTAREKPHRVAAMILDTSAADPRNVVDAPDRRRVMVAGLTVAAAGVPFSHAQLKKLGIAPPDATGLLAVGETMTYATHRALLSGGPLAREFQPDEVSVVAPVNGRPPQSSLYSRLLRGGFADWRLRVDGLVLQSREFTLAELRALPSATQITHLACEEGWSYVAEWRGVPLGVLLNAVGLSKRAKFVVFFAFDRSWNSLDLADAMHRQTLLAYGMNGRDLPTQHGAPLRLHIPRQLGYKQTKYLACVRVVEDLSEVRNGLGALAPESGFSWYAGI